MSGIMGHMGLLFDASTFPTGPLLDTYGSASAAYSVRKLRTAYAGSALRVVTSAAGNAEQDIGFDGSGNLDTTALLAFIGANNGTVKTWYDQSGNGLDVTQSTIANQPRLVTAGVLVAVNGKPSILGNGTSSSLASAYSMTALTSARKHSLSIVNKSARTSATEGIFILQRSTGYSYQSGATFSRLSSTLSKGFGSGTIGAFNAANYLGQTAPNSNTSALTIAQLFVDAAGAATSIHVDGAVQTLTTSGGTLNISSFMGDATATNHRVVMFADCDNANAINSWFQGHISEAITWASSQLANRAGIKGNQAAYFGTP